jgi:hypothetical protein
MTWTGWATVQDVSDGPAPIDVLLTASADEKVQPFKDNPQYAGSPSAYGDHEMPALTSNTEGKLRSIEIKMVFDEDEAPLAVGDIVNINGHFTKRPPAEEDA